MNFLIRADASVKTGTGHVMRCLTLASHLYKLGGNAIFACQDKPGNLIDFIKGKRFEVLSLPPNVETDDKNWQHADLEQLLKAISDSGISFDWVIVDHYEIGKKWETGIRKEIPQIMAIDDMANREHDCDIILDQNLTRNMLQRYDKLVPKNCRKFLGPRFALLREEFRIAAKKAEPRIGPIKNILVFFGGSDPTGETPKAIEAIKEVKGENLTFNILVGSSNPRAKDIKKTCTDHQNVIFNSPVEDMTKLMLDADLALGAPGTTSWERCILGLPTILVITADNQKEIAESLHAAGAAWNLGNSENVSSTDISEKITALVSSPEAIHEASLKALQVMDSGPESGVDLLLRLLFNRS